MATQTPNYHLKKPDLSDYYDIADFNGNSDILDSTLFSKTDKVERAISGNLASLDELGNLVDSGVSTTELGHKMGDILSTTDLNPGNDWLLCDGATLPTASYPDLSFELKTMKDDIRHNKIAKKVIAFGSNVTGLCYGNGYCVAAAANGRVYSKELSGTDWAASTVADNIELTGICYGSSYIVTAANGRIYYSTDRINWNSKIIASGVRLNSIRYLSTMLVITAANGNIYYCSGNNPSDTWTSKTLASGVNLTSSACYYGAPYVVSAANGNIYYINSSDFAGTWTAKTLSSGLNLTGVARYSSYWAVSTSNGSIYYCTASDPSGTWTAKILESGINLTSVENTWDWIVTGSNGKIYYSTSMNPSGTWYSKELDLGVSLSCSLYYGGYYLVGSISGYCHTTREAP
ncbi:hypothetical protein FACS1894198_3870 [Clostridia bacterium]|nr:hypothetical protein FACS1894198_3870 [Clostridia bacterium]